MTPTESLTKRLEEIEADRKKRHEEVDREHDTRVEQAAAILQLDTVLLAKPEYQLPLMAMLVEKYRWIVAHPRFQEWSVRTPKRHMDAWVAFKDALRAPEPKPDTTGFATPRTWNAWARNTTEVPGPVFGMPGRGKTAVIKKTKRNRRK